MLITEVEARNYVNTFFYYTLHFLSVVHDIQSDFTKILNVIDLYSVELSNKLLPFALASKTCLLSLLQGILLTWLTI